jgi:hypothetical protein
MNDTMTVVLASVFLATAGAGLYLYNNNSSNLAVVTKKNKKIGKSSKKAVEPESESESEPESEPERESESDPHAQNNNDIPVNSF